MNNLKKNTSLNSENGLNGFQCSKDINRSGCNRGFTMIELCIVIAIICTLAAIAIPNYLGYKYKARVLVAISDIRMIEREIVNFTTENGGQLPNSLSDLTAIGSINDPWGNPYRYLRIDGAIKNKGKKDEEDKRRRNMSDNPVDTDYDLYSMGRDGLSKPQFKFKDSQDDVVRAYNGQYVGLVSEL